MRGSPSQRARISSSRVTRAAARVDGDEAARVRLARLARVVALGGDAREAGEPLDEELDDLLVAAERRRLVLREVPLDGGEDPAQLLLADLHRPADPSVRDGVRVDPLDYVGSAEDQAGRLRAAKSLPAGEDGEVGAEVARVAPEVLGRRELRRRVDDDRDTPRVGAAGSRPRAAARPARS